MYNYIYIHIFIYVYVIYIYSRKYPSVTNTRLLAFSKVITPSLLSHRAKILSSCGQRCTGLWKWTQPRTGLWPTCWRVCREIFLYDEGKTSWAEACSPTLPISPAFENGQTRAKWLEQQQPFCDNEEEGQGRQRGTTQSLDIFKLLK